jgi:hypothetical protein
MLKSKLERYTFANLSEMMTEMGTLLSRFLLRNLFWSLINGSADCANALTREAKIGCAKSPRHPISPCDKDSDDLLMSVYVVFSIMLNDLFKSFNPTEEDELQVIQGQFVPYSVNSGHNLFNRLKHSILDFLLQHFTSPKVARTQVCRIRWMRNAVKLQIVKHIGHLATIVIDGIVHVHKNSLWQNLWKICLLVSTTSGNISLTKYS